MTIGYKMSTTLACKLLIDFELNYWKYHQLLIRTHIILLFLFGIEYYETQVNTNFVFFFFFMCNFMYHLFFFLKMYIM
jgi:hypothetical protein